MNERTIVNIKMMISPSKILNCPRWNNFGGTVTVKIGLSRMEYFGGTVTVEISNPTRSKNVTGMRQLGLERC